MLCGTATVQRKGSGAPTEKPLKIPKLKKYTLSLFQSWKQGQLTYWTLLKQLELVQNNHDPAACPPSQPSYEKDVLYILLHMLITCSKKKKCLSTTYSIASCDFNFNFQTKRNKFTLFPQEKGLHILNTAKRTYVHTGSHIIIQISSFVT